MQIIIPYAVALTFLYVILSVRTIRLRRTLKISIGDIGNEKMTRAMRVHANFAEYVPLSLFMIYLTAQNGGHPYLIHALGLSLLIGRVSHAFGVSQTKEIFKFRIFGMAMTFTGLIVSSLYLLINFIST